MSEELLTDMFGEGGKEEVKEAYEETLCGEPHNNAEESCLECEVMKANV